MAEMSEQQLTKRSDIQFDVWKWNMIAAGAIMTLAIQQGNGDLCVVIPWLSAGLFAYWLHQALAIQEGKVKSRTMRLFDAFPVVGNWLSEKTPDGKNNKETARELAKQLCCFLQKANGAREGNSSIPERTSKALAEVEKLRLLLLDKSVPSTLRAGMVLAIPVTFLLTPSFCWFYGYNLPRSVPGGYYTLFGVVALVTIVLVALGFSRWWRIEYPSFLVKFPGKMKVAQFVGVACLLAIASFLVGWHFGCNSKRTPGVPSAQLPKGVSVVLTFEKRPNLAGIEAALTEALSSVPKQVSITGLTAVIPLSDEPTKKPGGTEAGLPSKSPPSSKSAGTERPDVPPAVGPKLPSGSNGPDKSPGDT
jgi:hypothetical protein